jgi:hypothetical protein
MRGIQLRARMAFRSGRGRWLVPPWIAPAFILCALILVPWAAFLIVTLPRNYTANHWRVAWGGFDIALGAALVATSVAVIRRSPFAEVAATVCGTLLVCDAWFDGLVRRVDVTYHRGDRAGLAGGGPRRAAACCTLLLDGHQPRACRRGRAAVLASRRLQDRGQPSRAARGLGRLLTSAQRFRAAAEPIIAS